MPFSFAGRFLDELSRLICGNSRRMLRFRWLWLLLAAWGLWAPSPATAAGAWSPLVRNAPGSIGLMMLLSDGTVICMNSNTSNACYRLTPDSQGSYVNGTWTTLAPMISTRLYYSSQILKDGRIFVAGGEYGTGKTLGETYNPLTNTWTAAPVPGHTFSDANSEILPDGRVLCALVEDRKSTRLNSSHG